MARYGCTSAERKGCGEVCQEPPVWATTFMAGTFSGRPQRLPGKSQKGWHVYLPARRGRRAPSLRWEPSALGINILSFCAYRVLPALNN